MQNKARNLRPEKPLLPDKTRAIRPAQPEGTGSNAGLHKETVRPDSRERDQGTPFAFYKGPTYTYKRFTGDIMDARIAARQWGMIHGYMFDGELTEAGLLAAQKT